MPVDTIPLQQTSVTKNCCRCGSEFIVSTSGRVCPTCRKPKPPAELQPGCYLTFRERQIVARIVQGKLNKEIAYELHLSEGTIKEYLHRIFRKVAVANRTELAVWALVNQRTAA